MYEQRSGPRPSLVSPRRPQRGKRGRVITPQQRKEKTGEWARMQSESSCPVPSSRPLSWRRPPARAPPLCPARGPPSAFTRWVCRPPPGYRALLPGTEPSSSRVQSPQEVGAPQCCHGRPRALPHRLDALHPQPQLFSRPIAPDTAPRAAQLVAFGTEGLPIALGRRAKKGYLGQTALAP